MKAKATLFWVALLSVVGVSLTIVAESQSDLVQGSTEPVSPSVVATWTTVPGRQAIDLLVLWRGRPGWMTKKPQQQSGGGNRWSFSSAATYGDVNINVTFDRTSRKGTINGIAVDLKRDTIVLVDNVDTRVAVVRTLPLVADLEDGLIASALRASPAAVAFTNCDLKSEAVSRSAVFTKLCSRLQ